MKNTLNFFKQNDKYFFAGLFNTAQNNFDLSLNELEKRINTKQIESLGIIDFAFNANRTQLDFDNNFKYLSESLRFLNRIPSFIANKNKNTGSKIILRAYLKSFLKKLYNAIKTYRNYYTHYEHPKVEIDNEIIGFLNYILFNSANRVKDDRAKSEDVINRLFAKEKYRDDFIEIIKEQNDRNKKNGKRLLQEKGKNNFVINKIFQLFIDDRTQLPILTDVVKCDLANNKELSNSGFIQLLGLFLDKKQINMLFDNVIYTSDENNTELQKIITRWVYTYESYKPIKQLFKSEYDNDSLVLQMVSELSKCPNNLYDYLGEENKNEFIEDVNVYLKENATFFDDEALVSHEVIRKRYDDKFLNSQFSYFAIRFLDEFAKFKDLRFHINMGKFNHDTRPKKIESTGLETERRILEKITVFEKLSEATKKKNKYFQKSNEESISDWVEYPRPSYQFFNNSIGIWLKDGVLGKTDALQKRKNKKLSKFDILDKIGLKDCLKKPVAYLSFNELPALLYSFLIKKNTANEIEKQILKKINEQRKFISKITTETDANTKNLPKTLKKILKINDDFDWVKIEEHIKQEKQIKPLEEIRSTYRKLPKDKKILSLSEKGKIATWLSKDIKRFVTKAVKKDWKGYQFSGFQALLSYYDIDKSKLSAYLVKDLKFNVKEDMPFLGINFGKKKFI